MQVPDSESTRSAVCGLWSLCLVFASFNLVVLKLFSKDLWAVRPSVDDASHSKPELLVSGRHLSGRLLLKCYLIFLQDKID